MGYELHIFRKNDWEDDEEESNITLEEWLAYVAADSELQLKDGFQVDIPKVHTAWNDRPGFCIWLAHPNASTGSPPWFDYWSGTISAKYPHDATIKKMIEMATVLNARVQGDDMEYYDESYFLNRLESKVMENKQPKPWWKFWS